ncbi:uncharacterized protein FOMMEDRAFT_163618 [Fomitiporia mediterranea MF3/22]|uniref:Uncharacterized protein n=1 Tax=Fomitiporia mediterranea (strain MF3/22) TaxID=694068 RepID=R7SFB1_FOMME|nr:uncharacterized protein FOMMEDRAFT_163618 [Fomitiporia mediterranea MF3/22]EJC97393.1 hypothetical protein FOMMEDRAFT_163618 [Fomitiporia mediterranea MF3/22]
MFLVNIYLFASFGLSVKPTETMNVQSVHSFSFPSYPLRLFKGEPTSFLSLTGPTPALADCVFDESSAWIVEVCKPGNFLSCCAGPSLPSDLKLGSMSHHMVGFSDSVTSPRRPNAYEFPIIFAFIATVACPDEEIPCGIETERVHPAITDVVVWTPDNIVQLAVALEDAVELLIYTSEDSDKRRIALERHYLAGADAQLTMVDSEGSGHITDIPD